MGIGARQPKRRHTRSPRPLRCRPRTNLGDDHPISFVPSTGSTLVNPPAGSPVALDAAGQMQCVSCHEQLYADAIKKGPLPPGPTDVRVGFVLKHHGQLTFRQVVAQPYEGLKVVMEKLPGVQLERVSDAEDRKFQGKDLILATVPVPSVGSTIEFSVSGLPAELLILRYAAAILALVIGFGFAYLALYGKKETDQASSRRRQKLEQRRDALLAELVAAEQREAEPEASARAKPQKTRPRDKTLADLEQVYRHLDELDGN